MKNYYESLNEDPFNNLPVTFHVKTGLTDPEFLRFKTYYDTNIMERNKKIAQNERTKRDNIWIIKPGENTNRGNGIEVAEDFKEIKDLVAEATYDHIHTCIIQKYI